MQTKLEFTEIFKAHARNRGWGILSGVLQNQLFQQFLKLGLALAAGFC
jgi:hypothetical protein